MQNETPTEIAARQLIRAAQQMGAQTLVAGAISDGTLSELRALLCSRPDVIDGSPEGRP